MIRLIQYIDFLYDYNTEFKLEILLNIFWMLIVPCTNPTIYYTYR